MYALLFIIALIQLAFCRVAKEERTFVSSVVDKFISEIKPNFKDKELADLFESCYPNTLDTTVYSFTESDCGDEDTFLITGDITAMWLRDSTNQVYNCQLSNLLDCSLSEICSSGSEVACINSWCFESSGEISVDRSLRQRF